MYDLASRLALEGGAMTLRQQVCSFISILLSRSSFKFSLSHCVHAQADCYVAALHAFKLIDPDYAWNTTALADDDSAGAAVRSFDLVVMINV